MRVPAICSINIRNRQQLNKLTDPQGTSFAASQISKYVKLYSTLPDDVKRVLSPKDGVNMLKDMEYLSKGLVKRNLVGEGSSSKVYENAWLKEYDTLILNNSKDASKPMEVIYSKKPIGNVYWSYPDDPRIQLVSVA